MGTNALAYNDRVRYGKGLESQIIQQMRAQGMCLDPASRRDDTCRKVDAWWVSPTTRRGIQIKYRETGDDIIFEIYKDFQNKVLGRDMVGDSDLYLCVNRKGRGYLVSTREIKDIVNNALDLAKQSSRPWTTFSNQSIQMKLRPDAFHRQMKLVGFIRSESLHVIKHMQFKLKY